MQDLSKKAQLIKVLALDVDGVLTSGIIYYGNQELEMKGFFVQDGLGMKLLQKTDVSVAIISAKTSEAVTRRLADLNITLTYLGCKNKLPAYEDLKQKLKVQDHEVAYMGDDLPDLPLLLRAGLSLSVPQAPAIVKQSVDYVTKKKGGKGAVREACEFIMNAQGKYDAILQTYLTK